MAAPLQMVFPKKGSLFSRVTEQLSFQILPSRKAFGLRPGDNEQDDHYYTDHYA